VPGSRVPVDPEFQLKAVRQRDEMKREIKCKLAI
jgi:hypothetical protein